MSSNGPPTISILIPCYNEEAGLGRMASELRPVLDTLCTRESVEVVLVDDGSTDGTWGALNRLASSGFSGAKIHLLRHARNRGLGAALRTGFAACRGSVVVTTDSDSTYRLSEIPRLLSRLEPDVDIVTASQYHPDGSVMNVPAHRLLLSRGASLLYRTLVTRRVHTYTSLFRAYRAPVIRDIPFRSDGFLAVSELLVNAMRAGYRVAEYPTVLHSRVEGTSKAKLARTTAAHARFMAGILLQRLHLRSHPPLSAPATSQRQ
jgi:dolichol-phosphate mannosyltransferase